MRVRVPKPIRSFLELDELAALLYADAGIREVQMSLDLVQAIVEHLDRLRRAGQPTGPDDFSWPTAAADACARDRVGAIVTDGGLRRCFGTIHAIIR